LIIRAFADVYQENKRLFIQDVTSGPFSGYFVRTLLAALNVGNGSDQVSEVQVNRVINWLRGTRKTEVLDVMYKVFTETYFFGIMDTDSSNKILNQNHKPGTYLIRAALDGNFYLDYFPKKRDSYPQSVLLNDYKTFEQLDKGYKQTLAGLHLKKEKYCKIGRPEVLSGLKIQISFITSENNKYLTNAKRRGPPSLAPPTTIAHYEMIF